MVRYTVLKGHYELEKTIGCGGFAKVKLATHILTGEKVAIKIMDKIHLGEDLPRVQLEMKALKNLSHQHICKLYQVIETEAHYFMVMEYCAGGELFDHIVERSRLSEREARCFFRQIVSAVAYLHERGYAHRDLKPENVLFDKEQTVKLIDFGLCAKPKDGMESQLATSCGSPTYAAPELVVGKKYLGPQVDIWSMGVLLYALLCGYLPFDDNSIDNLYRKILNGKYEEPNWLSAGSKRLISSMLQVDPNKRITIDKLVCHPWLTMGYDGPVTKGVHDFHEKDDECLDAMSMFHRTSRNEIWSRLSSWKYDYDTATYLLLLTRKKRGLPVKLMASSRLVFKKRLIYERGNKLNDGENGVVNLQDSPVSPLKPFNETYLVLKGKESTPDKYDGCKVVISSNKSIDEKENRFDAVCRTPTRRSGKRFRSPSLDRTASPGALALKQMFSVDSGVPVLANGAVYGVDDFEFMEIQAVLVSKKSTYQDIGKYSRPVTPLSSKKCDGVSRTESPNHSPLSARKVFCSIEKSLCRMRHVLTPRRRYASNADQPLVLGTKGLCNVSTTSSSDPEQVLIELKRALTSKGISCKQKGFTLRGRVEQNANESDRYKIFGKSLNSRLSFELEVCLIPIAAGCSSSQQQSMVGILRKRLNGDTWCYKKVCEEVLALAAVDLQHSARQ